MPNSNDNIPELDTPLEEEEYYPEDELPQRELTPLVITADERREILGKLMDFEACLVDLPPMQASFVLAMLQDPTNVKAAAMRAGAKETAAQSRGTQWLNNHKVAAAIAAGQQLREDRTRVTSDRTLHELSIIAYSNIGDYMLSGDHLCVRDGVPEYAMRAVSQAEYKSTTVEVDGVRTTESTVKIKLWSKTDALRMLAMYQKLLTGHEGTGGGVYNDNRQVHVHNTWEVGGRKITF